MGGCIIVIPTLLAWAWRICWVSPRIINCRYFGPSSQAGLACCRRFCCFAYYVQSLLKVTNSYTFILPMPFFVLEIPRFRTPPPFKIFSLSRLACMGASSICWSTLVDQRTLVHTVPICFSNQKYMGRSWGDHHFYDSPLKNHFPRNSRIMSHTNCEIFH